MKTYFRFIILGVFSYFLACNSSTSSINPENSKVKDLFGQKWALYSFRSEDGNKINLNPNETYNIVFTQNDTLNGKADCNTYFSEYNAKDGGEIKIEPCIQYPSVHLLSLVSCNPA